MELLRDIALSIKNMIQKSTFIKVDDSKDIQEIQIKGLGSEIRNFFQRFQNYGFTSNPLNGSQGVTIFPGGSKDHGIIIAVDDRRFRLKNLAPGEVALYTDEGDKIHFKRGNQIDIVTKTLNVTSEEVVNIVTKSATIDSETAIVKASTKATVEAPESEIISPNKVSVTTPLMEVSGLLKCAGLGAGATPVSGKAKVAGDIEATGTVKDSAGTMQQIRDTYNGHEHETNGPTPIQQM